MNVEARGYRSHMSHEVLIIREGRKGKNWNMMNTANARNKRKKSNHWFQSVLPFNWSWQKGNDRREEKEREKEKGENSLSSWLERTTAADISQIFLHTFWQRTNWSQNIDQTQTQEHTQTDLFFFFFFFSCFDHPFLLRLSWSIYMFYRPSADATARGEKPSLSMLYEQHRAGGLSSEFVQIRTVVLVAVIWTVSPDDASSKFDIGDLISFVVVSLSGVHHWFFLDVNANLSL